MANKIGNATLPQPKHSNRSSGLSKEVLNSEYDDSERPDETPLAEFGNIVEWDDEPEEVNNYIYEDEQEDGLKNDFSQMRRENKAENEAEESQMPKKAGKPKSEDAH